MRWFAKQADPALTTALASFLRSSPSLFPKSNKLTTHDATTLSRLLVARGIEDPKAAEMFLSPSLSHLHSANLMSGMAAALE
jgi:hypothetical protein